MKDVRERMDDYHAYQSTNGGSGGGNGSFGGDGCGGFGCGFVVIVIVAILFVSLLLSGADWEAFDTLLGLGLLVFLVVRFLFR